MACSASPALNDSSAEMMCEALEENGVSDELLRFRAAKDESSCNVTVCEHGAAPCTCIGAAGAGVHWQLLRRACLSCFMQHCRRERKLPAGSWFSMVLLLDLYFRRAGMSSPQKLPVLCTAIVDTLRKMETRQDSTRVVGVIAAHSHRFFGVPQHDHTSPDEHLEQERELMRVLNGDLHLPSVYQWTVMLCKRLNVISSGVLSTSVDMVQNFTLASASTLLAHTPHCGGMTPRRIATGLVCIGLIAKQLVPVESLRPAMRTDLDWEALLSRVMGAPCPLACIVPEEHRERMLSVLSMTTGRVLGELSRDTYAAAVAADNAISAARADAGLVIFPPQSQ